MGGDLVARQLWGVLTPRAPLGQAGLRKTLLSTNPIESLCLLARHRERNVTCTRGSALLQRWLGTVWLYGEQPCKRVNGCAGMAQVLATIEAEHAEPQSAPTKKAV